MHVSIYLYIILTYSGTKIGVICAFTNGNNSINKNKQDSPIFILIGLLRHVIKFNEPHFKTNHQYIFRSATNKALSVLKTLEKHQERRRKR